MKDPNSWTTKSQAQKSPGATGLLQLQFVTHLWSE